MPRHLAEALNGELDGWSGLTFRHVSPSFDPLSTRGAELHGGRWNAPGTPALYLATSVETARAEFDRLVELRAQSASDLLPRVLVTVRLELTKVVDLRVKSILRELGVSDKQFENLLPEACLTAGSLARASGASALVAPSVTGTGTILVAFPDKFTDQDKLELVDQTNVDWT